MKTKRFGKDDDVDRTHDPSRHQCTFTGGDLRCPLPAVFGEGVGKESPRWCWIHGNDRPFGAMAAHQLRDIILNQASLLRARYGNTLRAELEATIDNNPQWKKKYDEPSRHYAERMLGELRKAAKGGIASRLPYDPAQSLGGDWTAEEIREAEQERAALQSEADGAF